MNELINNEDKLTMTSLEISELTGKRHDSILRDIDNMLESLTLSQHSFVFAQQSETGEMRRYRLPKDLTLTLVSGYNAKLRKAIIDKWLELENTKPQTFEEIMKNALILADQKVKQLENKVQEDKPLVEFANTVADSSDVILVREYAKLLFDKEGIQIGQNKLFKWFRENGYLNYKNEPYQQYMNYFKIIETITTSIFGTKIHKTTKITGQGQLYFLGKLKEYYFVNKLDI